VTHSALRLVDKLEFYTKELDLRFDGSQGESHSLHYMFNYPEQSDPELIGYVLDYTTKKGQAVLDPFCGSGTVGLESALKGRVPVLSDINQLAVLITQAILQPADISEITLKLQMIPFSRPINTNLHDSRFEPFYDIRTFCEIFNLRQVLISAKRGSDLFLKMVAMSLLHGQSSGYFSTYTYPQIALSPEEQKQLNRTRKQVPDYRAVAPRILRKVASVLRDGVPSVFRHSVSQGGLKVADARNLLHVPTSSIDAIVTAPPLPNFKDLSQEHSLKQQWLKLWFAGVEIREDVSHVESDLESWKDFMNESLLELARVTKPQSRASFLLTDIKVGNKNVCLAEEMKSLVTDNLSRYWDLECLLINKPAGEVLGSQVKPRESSLKGVKNKILILRRKS
jgi:hypothetical protein